MVIRKPDRLLPQDAYTYKTHTYRRLARVGEK